MGLKYLFTGINYQFDKYILSIFSKLFPISIKQSLFSTMNVFTKNNCPYEPRLLGNEQ